MPFHCSVETEFVEFVTGPASLMVPPLDSYITVANYCPRRWYRGSKILYGQIFDHGEVRDFAISLLRRD